MKMFPLYPMGWTREQIRQRPFLLLYEDVVLKAPHGAILVEVGVFRGASFFELLRLARVHKRTDLQIYGVDDWSDRAYPPGEERPPLEGAGKIVYDRMMAEYGDMQVGLITGDSAIAANEFKDGFVHFVYLDGSHDYQSVLKDIDAWRPKIADGGRLAGDDLDHKKFPDVRKAVEHAFGAEDRQWRSNGPLEVMGFKSSEIIKGFWVVDGPC